MLPRSSPKLHKDTQSYINIFIEHTHIPWSFRLEAFLGENHTWLIILHAPSPATKISKENSWNLTVASVWVKLPWESWNKQLPLWGGKKVIMPYARPLNWGRINSAYNKSLLTSSLKTSCAPKPGGVFSSPRRELHKCRLLFVCATFIREVLTGIPYRVWTNPKENSYPPKTNRGWLITYYHILQLRLWKMCTPAGCPVFTSLILNSCWSLAKGKENQSKRMEETDSSFHCLKKKDFFLCIFQVRITDLPTLLKFHRLYIVYNFLFYVSSYVSPWKVSEEVKAMSIWQFFQVKELESERWSDLRTPGY